MKGRKVLLMCLSILMVLGMSGAFSLMAKAQTYGDFTYYVWDEDGPVDITGYKGSKLNITIPAKIDGKKVYSIDIDAFKNCKTLKTVVIEEGIEIISENAFSGCRNLKSITIPNSIKNIEDEAFYFCDKLENVSIGNKVKKIGDNAFGYCENLKSITIPNNVQEIGDGLFYSCSNLEKIILPKNLSSINEEMFYYCENLKSITIPNSVKEIGSAAFSMNNKLKRINYNGTIEQWKKIKVASNENECLKKANIYCTDGTIEYVESTGFYTCNLGKQFIGVEWEKVSNATGYEIQLATDKKFTKNKKTVVIKKQNQKKAIIKNLKANQKYYIRGRVYKSQVANKKTIKSYSDWSEIKSVELKTKKSNDRVSGDYEYSINKDNTVTITACSENGTKLTIPSKLGGKKVTKIGEYSLEGWDFKSVKIPNTVTEIGRGAFWSCDKLKSISMQKGLKKIGDNAFGVCTELKKVTIPSTVTEIGKSAFASCSKLERINLKKGLKKIGRGAFYECVNLKTVILPEGLTEIGRSAFLHCLRLKSVNVPKSVKKIGGYAFCASRIKTITIPNGVKQIPEGIFEDCHSLTKVVLPNSLTKIGDSAFSDCGSLANVKYTGTKKQWKSIKIGKNNKKLTGTKIHCKNGTI